MAFEWLIKLNDMVSDPATRIERSLNRVQQQLKEVSIAAATNKLSTITDPLKRQSIELGIQRDRLMMSKRALDQNSGALSTLNGWSKNLRQSMRDWAIILYPVAQGLKFVWDTALSLASSITGVMRTTEDAMLGAKYSFGSSSQDMIKMAQDLSVRSGRPVEELYQQMMKFGNLGAPKELIRPMMLAISDMQVLGGDAAKLQFTLTNMFSKPVLDLQEIKRGLQGVTDETLFWKQLAKDLGVPYENITKLVEQNRVSGKTGAIALLETVQGREGSKLGKISFERADTTLGGILDRFQAKLTNLIAGIADTPGFKLFKDAMNNLLGVLSDQKTEGLVRDIANQIGEMVKPLTGEEGRKNLQEFFDILTQNIKDALPLISGFGDVLKNVFKYGAGKGDIVQDVKQDFSKGWNEVKQRYSLFPEKESFKTLEELDRTNAARGVQVDQPGNKLRRIIVPAITLDIYAVGATKEDADHIAAKSAEATKKVILDVHQQINTEAGASDDTE